jgi:bifunctional non-homologous end joining protein LigD
MTNGGAKRIVLRCISVVSTLLKKLIADTDVQFSESFEVDGQEMFKHACGVGLEGVVSKVQDSR